MSGNVTVAPLALVRVVEPAIEFCQVALPWHQPHKSLYGAVSWVDGNGYLLPNFKRQLAGQF